MTTYKSVKYNISGADLTGLTAGQIPNLDTAKITTGTLADARISASSVSQHATTYDDNKLQSNVALLGFKTAVNGSLAKYNLQDQIIDEYIDATGVDASASTNESLTAGVYSGASVPALTHNADTTGTDGSYTWHKYTSTGSVTYTPSVNQSVDFLVIAGGASGGSGNSSGGGGGAGGYRNSYASEATGGGGSNESNLSFIGGTTYTITVGTGGTSVTGVTVGVDGGTSSITGSDITDITTVGGGGGGAPLSGGSGRVGGSGGGGGAPNGGHAPGAGTANQGYGGGTTYSTQWSGAGGGGAGGAGVNVPSSGNNYATAGGVGLTSSIDGTGTFRAGGGGGAGDATSSVSQAGGNGGGGAGSNDVGVDATINTGSGGGSGGTTSGIGGTGIIILRRLTDSITSGANLTLQSNDTTASTANPDYADMVMLMENSSGTATLNTDIKGYISEDSGVTFTQGTLVDEGTWGTNKKILAFHDLDISAQTGSAMCYKITTHNQSAGVKETKIHATSIGWR
tara:strand:- start:151 stop:1689 length:1539 start_codon:yes stop_codon:yes gene_type:complete